MNPESKLYEYVLDWLDIYKRRTVKDATFSRLVTSTHELKEHEISHMPIKSITSVHIQHYISELVARGYGQSTIKKQLLLITAPLKQAAANHLIPADPSSGIQLPRDEFLMKQKKKVLAYTKEEQDKILRIASEPEVYEIDITAGLAILFLLETGLRSGELLALHWEDVHIERKMIKVCATLVNPTSVCQSHRQLSSKTASSNRVVPLTPKAISILEKCRVMSSCDSVFANGDNPLNYRVLKTYVEKICKLANIPYYGTHALRHTFATNCYYKGMDVKILSKILGHSSTTVTYNVYIDLYGNAFDEMYAALVRPIA